MAQVRTGIRCTDGVVQCYSGIARHGRTDGMGSVGMKDAERREVGEGATEVDFYLHGEYLTTYPCTPAEADHIVEAWESGELDFD